MKEENICPKCGDKSESSGACAKCLAQFAMGSTGAGPASAPGQKSDFPSDEPVLPNDSFIGPYKIVSLIGRGGMGTVYKAYQKSLNRFVAVKVLPAKLSNDQEFAKRFDREAKALASLSHPNIVAVYDMGQAAGRFYFVMELVEGVALRDLIADRKLQPARALMLVPQLCDALEYAHSEGVIHRDIKPENLLMDKNGRIKIADFGLARIVKGDIRVDPVTCTRQIMGTPDYMAPEQRTNSKDVDHRADIYSLGVVFYEMLTGELPVGRFELPSRKVQIDVRLGDVVLKSLEQEPARRYQKVSEMGTAITEITSGPTLVEAAPQAAAEKEPPIPQSFLGKRWWQTKRHMVLLVWAVSILVQAVISVISVPNLNEDQFVVSGLILFFFNLIMLVYVLRDCIKHNAAAFPTFITDTGFSYGYGKKPIISQQLMKTLWKWLLISTFVISLVFNQNLGGKSHQTGNSLKPANPISYQTSQGFPFYRYNAKDDNNIKSEEASLRFPGIFYLGWMLYYILAVRARNKQAGLGQN
ncbi:MAG: serine/threonine-protein kinase [Planctomycetota bacterium]